MNLFGLELPRMWQRRTAAQLSASIIAQNKMTPMPTTEAFKAAMAHGESAVEQQQIFGELFAAYALPSSNYKNDLRSSLHDGRLESVEILAMGGASLLSWSQLTQDALAAVIAEAAIVPTEAEVTAELTMMGFEWDGSAWVMSEAIA